LASRTLDLPKAASESGQPAQKAQMVVLVVIDGVRWQEVFGGVDADLARRHGMQPARAGEPAMPNLETLVREDGAALGAPGHGAPVSATGPALLSLPGYLELFTGQASGSCTRNSCPSVSRTTITDQLAQLPDGGPENVAVIASWEGIARAASTHPSDIVLSAGRTSGTNLDRLRYDPIASELLDAGRSDGPGPGHGDFRRDRATAAIALRYLKTQSPRFLFVGLGEPDEYAHANSYRGYLQSLAFADQVVAEIATEVRLANARGRRSTLWVTTDHGRSRDFVGHGPPESGRVWLFAAGFGIQARGLVHAPEPRHLADITATLRWLTGHDPEEPGSSVLTELLQP
jgi:hypothetical protein